MLLPTKMEDIAVVRDENTEEYRNGYHNTEITALSTERKLPIPVYTKVFFKRRKRFCQQRRRSVKGIEFLSKHFKKSNIRTFDRGFDNNRYYKYLLSHKENFVIRAKKNRDVMYNQKKINLLELANCFKSKY